MKTTREFQFPSNGKAYPKQLQLAMLTKDPDEVSIPFQRESVPKDITKVSASVKGISFNSLPTGKRTQRGLGAVVLNALKKFQFPSNGKAYPKAAAQSINVEAKQKQKVSIPFQRESVPKVSLPSDYGWRSKVFVSIPFQRESVPKVQTSRHQASLRGISFNSLPTGKRTQSWLANKYLARFKDLQFQFPSNGKAYPKLRWR